MEKNAKLLSERNICFEEIQVLLDRNCLVDILIHPKQDRYPGQGILVVRGIQDTYLVPFIESANGLFLKTIYPSRKAQKSYPRSPNGQA
jgi:hypothetical protein